MKKKLLILAMLVICATSIASGTLAYFTAEETAHNVITSSGVNIKIEEWQETDEGLIPYPKEKPIQVMPNTKVSKIVTVKNEDADSFIRVGYEIILKDNEGNVMDISLETLASIVSVNLNEVEWLRKEGDDNWWYYNKNVSGGEVTAPLFTEVVFDGPNMTNEYQNCIVEVIVNAQAVQTANNGDSVMEAEGWPED